MVWKAPGLAVKRPPELYAIVAGASDYAGDALKLRYAAHDAENMAAALTLGAKRLFGAEKVHLTLLTTSLIGERPRELPTRANLQQAFESAAKEAHPEDILVVYLAGHGATLSRGLDTYCYLTCDASGQDDLLDPARLAKVAITSEELQRWITQIPTLKQVMILDTCAAGAAAGKLVDKRDISSDQIRAIERLKDRTGFHILMGCAADAASYETSQFGQGLLTHSLLEGMKGAALREGEFVDVSELFNYAADQVPLLAQGIGGLQRPVISAPQGTSFDVGELTPEDKAQVPVTAARILILRPTLLNPATVGDPLGLTAALLARLRQEDNGQASEKNPLAFVDADSFPGAIVPKGVYNINGRIVTVHLKLWRDGKDAGTVTVSGEVGKPEAIADEIVRKLQGI
jgi:hypothetical protein